ncbi:hypothetical protein [Sphaerotilus natans]|nr:hypothetical protein [Sphaerotilus natans]
MTAEGADALRGVFSGLVDSEFFGGIADALTQTGRDAEKAVIAEMRTQFDRPTPFALGSLFLVPATAQKLVAELDVKDRAAYFMRPQTQGGSRKAAKAIEDTLQKAGLLPAGWYCVPGAGATLDRYGNMSPSQITQILSQLKVQRVGGFDRAMSTNARSQINAQRRAGGRFFLRRVGEGKAPGVYQREFMGRTVTPVLVFVRSVRYAQRINLEQITQRTVDQRLTSNVMRSLAKVVQRLNRPGAQRSLF